VRRLGVALIASCVVTLVACGASSSPRGVVVSNTGLRLTGIHWVLTQVSHAGARPVAIPQFTGADLEFQRDGTVLADDGLNALNAEFTATATTITVRNPSSSAVGYGGHDPVLDATTGSLGHMFDY
jgi:heat shock protein HslJ